MVKSAGPDDATLPHPSRQNGTADNEGREKDAKGGGDGWPLMRASPAVGVMTPVKALIIVLFPAPLGPCHTKIYLQALGLTPSCLLAGSGCEGSKPIADITQIGTPASES